MPMVSTLPCELDRIRSHQRLVVHNAAGQLVAHHLLLALDPWTRLRGLLGRDALEPGEGMLLRPCAQVHSFFMRYPIDVLFVSRLGEVLALHPRLEPWRTSRHVAGARGVLELSAGQAAATGTQVGHRLVFSETDAKV